MEILAWNTDKQRLTTMDVEFTDENTTWFEDCAKDTDIQRITDVDGGILISRAGYNYPVWISGQSRTDIKYSRVRASRLEKLALSP